MAKKRKTSPLNFYGYREQLDFDPKTISSKNTGCKNCGTNPAEQEKRDEGQDEKIKALERELNATKRELNSTKSDLNNTKSELNRTKTELNATKSELNSTKNDLNNTKNELNRTKNELNATNNELDSLEQDVQEFEQSTGQAINKLSGESFAAVSYDSGNTNILFYNADGEQVGELDASPFVSDKMIDSVEYDADTKSLVITFITESGEEQVIIPFDEIFSLDAGDGIDVSGTTVSIKLDESSEETEKFLSLSENGLMLSGITDEIESKSFWKAPDAEDKDDFITVIKDGNGDPVIKIGNDGELFLMVEGELMSVNNLLGQLAHEEY